ncbi:Enoyl-CoA hydratase/carnithine racemase [Desulfatibacillum alkenivorans DSM 16219]|jgi:enoyl-CoA hydratase|uniref:Enoyl-CoA hydratase/carnithine racemase n=1 Tax=Desulfatibacillum alkenivorans DSM 16219 TaxID=1121393 RepID=A0A1M6I8X2_9BACT|nr:enoyl-CoA hydratase/isomerase family protein [Desulfatibacillum alkenivorans]SHJ30788.1 Enoyl-CoA hydratase/carnithine racemase [Desulfatibacillum alkenivorans DSM 16219]
MNFEYMDIQVQDDLGIVTMNRAPENRVNGPFIQELTRAFQAVKENADIKAVILASALEKFFSNGYDLEWMAANFSEIERVQALLEGASAFLADLCVFPKPVIAAMNGHTYGEGAFIAGCCDYRIMRQDRGWVCFPEVHINKPFIPGQIAIMREILSPRAFRDMALFGRRYGGPEALEIGFVDQISPLEELMDRAKAMAGEMLAFHPDAFAEIKKRIRSPLSKIIREQDPPVIQRNLGLA